MEEGPVPAPAIWGVAVSFLGPVTPGSHPTKTTLRQGSSPVEARCLSMDVWTLGSQNVQLLTTLGNSLNSCASVSLAIKQDGSAHLTGLLRDISVHRLPGPVAGSGSAAMEC